MKKVAFLLLALFTYYWAGMYHALPLMVLCVLELLLFIALLVLPRALKRRLTACFPKQSEATEDGVETVCRVHVKNSGRLPASRVQLRLRIWYAQDSKGVEKKLYGGGGRGENALEFQVCPAYCGLIWVRMDRLRVYDYLSMFSSAKRIGEEMKLAVFPREQALRFAISPNGREESRPLEEQTFNHAGDSIHEIRQIREYRIGDSNRHIHWNQSAKTEQLWIKEYEKDLDSRADVLLDVTGFFEPANAEAPAWSTFYRLLSALVLGLLRDAATVRVHWCPGGGSGLLCMDVANAEQCRSMLLSLYQTEFVQESEPVPGVTEQVLTLRQSAFRLTSGLAVFAGERLIHQFSAENLEQEIRGNILVV